MASRDTPRSPDPDDWFAGSDGAPRRARPGAARAPEPDDDDWVGGIGGARRPRMARTSLSESFPDRRVPIVAGAVLLLIVLVAGLALAGVFSGSKQTQAATTAPFTAPTTAPTTTQAVTTVPAPTTTLKPGDTGAQVKALQRALASLGYTVGKVDGDYGTATKTAVAKFQTAAKLTPDGVFGPATRAALVKALASG
jgi:hypothetical protein